MRSTMQPEPLLISRILEYGTTVHGRCEAVTWSATGPRRTGYRDLGRECRRAANALRALGVTGDDRVATFQWNNEEHLVLYLAVPASGAVLHPVNIRLAPAQIVHVMRHADDRVVVVDASLAAPFSRLVPALPMLRHVVVNGAVDAEVRRALGATGCQVHDYRSLLDAQDDDLVWPDLDEDDAAALCYTSGTTGDPHGVAYSHRSNVLHAYQVISPGAFGAAPGDRCLAIVPMFHANAWGVIYGAMLGGTSLVLPDRHLGAAQLVEMINSENVTLAGAVPTIWNDVLTHLRAHPGTGLPTLRRAVVGGSACPPSLMEAFDGYGVEVVHAWGMTETSPLGTVAVPAVDADPAVRARQRLTQGRLAPLVRGRIVGPDGTVLPWDGRSAGELQVRGPWVTGSYLGEESDRFDDGWLCTGDVGTLDEDGFLQLTDRVKDVIKSGGEWISSVELENLLMGHPDVHEASVIGVPDDRWGERPLATVVLAEGVAPDPDGLREWLGERVPRWQLPERWAFVPQVPRTGVGKFDKRALRSRYSQGELPVVRAEG